jgi:hypothetical protein
MDDLDRTLRIEIPAVLLGKGAIEEEWSIDTSLSSFNGWLPVIVAGVTTLSVYWTGTIDLSGYARDYKTFVPAGGVLQEGAYAYEKGSDGSIVYTVISSTPLVAEQVRTQLASLSGPGLLSWGAVGSFGEQQQNFEQIIFAQSTMYVPNSQIVPNTYGILQPQDSRQTGSMSPTAAEVLYCMKMILPLALDQTTLGIPASRVLLIGKMTQEPELEYMMRLSRSVQLAGQ